MLSLLIFLFNDYVFYIESFSFNSIIDSMHTFLQYFSVILFYKKDVNIFFFLTDFNNQFVIFLNEQPNYGFFFKNHLKGLFYFFFFTFLIGLFIYFCSMFFVVRFFKDNEKISPYECGFSPFEDSRSQFDIQFYIIAILFIIFDVEINFLFPWVIVFDYLNFVEFFVMIFFLILLTLGFMFEWSWDALDWQ